MTAPVSDAAIEVFFSYSHRDESLMQELVKHLSILKRQGVIQDWHDRKIGAGQEWAGEIDSHLNSAQVILLLISSDFLASDYCYDIEMQRAMQRHEAGEARVIPVILRPVDWKGTPFSKLQSLPKDGKPITSGSNQDEAFLDVARGIRSTVETFAQSGQPAVPPREGKPQESADRTASPDPFSAHSSQGDPMKQYNFGKSTGFQTKVEGGTVYIGSTHIHSQPAAIEKPDAKTILFLAANPKDATRMRLDQEVRDIQEGLRLANQRDRFVLEQRWAVRPRDVRRAMLEVKPQIVHFSGQGEVDGSLALENDAGDVQRISPEALTGLFALFADQVECVVLNACYSEEQATGIVQHIPYVIGMSDDIERAAALEFAVAFYDALGAGRSVEFAYKLGCNAIQMAGVAGHLVPVLKQRPFAL